MGRYVSITKHAYERGRKRMGIPRRALERMAEKAISSGVPCTKSYRVGIVDDSSISILCGNHVFVFDVRPGYAVLLTVLNSRFGDNVSRPSS